MKYAQCRIFARANYLHNIYRYIVLSLFSLKHVFFRFIKSSRKEHIVCNIMLMSILYNTTLFLSITTNSKYLSNIYTILYIYIYTPNSRNSFSELRYKYKSTFDFNFQIVPTNQHTE